MAATPSAQPRLWRRSHHPEDYGDGGAAPCSRPNDQAQHHTWRATPGLQACLPTGYGGGDQQPMPRRRAGAPASQAETDRAARGRTHLGQRTEAMSMNRGEIARSPQSEE
jgi:hypothetical protein